MVSNYGSLYNKQHNTMSTKNLYYMHIIIWKIVNYNILFRTSIIIFIKLKIFIHRFQ